MGDSGTGKFHDALTAVRQILVVLAHTRIHEFEKSRRTEKASDFSAHPHWGLAIPYQISFTHVPRASLATKLERHTCPRTSPMNLFVAASRIQTTSGNPLPSYRRSSY
jgi:hypothetical protein